MRFAFIVFLALIGLQGCSSEETSPAQNWILGYWELTHSIGGIAGETTTPEETGRYMNYHFDESTATFWINDTLIWERPYEVLEVNDPTDYINFQLRFGSDRPQNIHLQKNHLALRSVNDDGYDRYFIRE